MKSKLLLALSTIFCAVSLNGQAFKTAITFDDFQGTIDTVYVGYDENATVDVDANLGETDISGDPAFRDIVKLAQIDIFKFQCREENIQLEDISTYQSLTDILPKECIEFVPYSTIGDIIPVSAVLIPNSRIPVLMRWDKSEFESECLVESLVTDWKPDYWWDIYCHNSGLERISMQELTAILIDRPVGDQITDQFGDTYSILYIALIGDIELSDSDIDITDHFEISPNPARGEITISADLPVEKIEIYDLGGNLLQGEYNSNKIFLRHHGINIVKTTFESGEVTVKKVVNNLR